MRTKLVLHNCKNYEVAEENNRDFKIGDTFYFNWCGITDVQEVTDANILAEVNGTIPPNTNPNIIDLTSNFYKCVRKVIIH